MFISGENKRLKEFRRLFNKDQKEIADVLGISRAGVSNIETGRTKLTEANIISLCKEYYLNPEWIKHGTEPIILKKSDVEDSLIPIIADIPAGAWENHVYFFTKHRAEKYSAVPCVQGKNLFGVSVKGNSMEPLLYEGDILTAIRSAQQAFPR